MERAHGEHVEGMWKSVEECGIKRNPSRTPRWNMEDVDMWKERGTLGLHVGGTLDFSTLEDKEAYFLWDTCPNMPKRTIDGDPYPYVTWGEKNLLIGNVNGKGR